ncbi:hypothetical protein [Halorussus litoreus]|uniref:hypothetical protein n=1 Tax=Halorussus litoreus TaxID=1710536 RepID=UPI000E228957|nr:hypothetical protein [Halorussus litoreus]
MSKSDDKQAVQRTMAYGTTLVELAKRQDGTWEATQTGLDIVGTGNSAARATEDMARQIAELKEANKL